MMKKEQGNVKIIYLIGVGHSGSTLIERLINSSPNAYSVGETKHLRNKFLNKEEIFPVADNMSKISFRSQINPRQSIFWGPIINEIERNKYNIYDKKSSCKEKIGIFFNILLGRLNRGPENYDEEEFYNLVYNQAKEVKGGNIAYIVDSSKDLRRAYYLLQKLLIDLYVIHVTRDVRGVVNSQEKLGKNWLATAFHWLTLNFITQVFMKKFINSDKRMTIRYDMFAQNSDKYLKALNKKFHLSIDPENYLKAMNKDASQRFAGNKMLYKKVEAIGYDQKWKRELSGWKKAILTMFFYLPNKFWVFNQKAD